MCRSATYYAGFGLCKLSEESRRSAPASFRPAQRGTTYLENECAVRECEIICRWRKIFTPTVLQCRPTASISTCRVTTSPSRTPTCPRWPTWRAAGRSATTSRDTTAGGYLGIYLLSTIYYLHIYLSTGPSTTTQPGGSASSPQVRLNFLSTEMRFVKGNDECTFLCL